MGSSTYGYSPCTLHKIHGKGIQQVGCNAATTAIYHGIAAGESLIYVSGDRIFLMLTVTRQKAIITLPSLAGDATPMISKLKLFFDHPIHPIIAKMTHTTRTGRAT